jgi:hypothetical protein
MYFFSSKKFPTFEKMKKLKKENTPYVTSKLLMPDWDLEWNVGRPRSQSGFSYKTSIGISSFDDNKKFVTNEKLKYCFNHQCVNSTSLSTCQLLGVGTFLVFDTRYWVTVGSLWGGGREKKTSI